MTTPSAAPKVYSYVRFSTPEQSKGDSKRRQNDLAAAYAARHKLTLDTDLTLEDLGVSAYRGKNLDEASALGGFLKAIADGDVAPGSVLIVENLDRLSRGGAWAAITPIQAIINAGVDIVTFIPNEERYSRERMQRDMTAIMMMVVYLERAAEESRVKSKRVGAARAAGREAARSGRLYTRLVPGWIRTTPDRKMELIPERAAIVRRVFDMFLTGTGKESIAKALNAEGVQTFGRGKSQAAHWRKSYIAKILENSACVGTFTPHTDDGTTRTPQATIKGYYPAAVDAETFERVRSLLSTSRTREPVSSLKVRNILAGLARCPKCAGAMTRVWKGSRGGEAKLVCAAAKLGECEYFSVNLSVVTAALVRTAGDPVPSPVAGLDEEIRGAQAGLESLAEQITTLVDQIERQPSKALTSRLRLREEARDRAAAALAELERRAVDGDKRSLKRRRERYRDVLMAQPLDVAAANAALKEMVSKVVVDYTRGTLRMSWRHDGETEIAYEM